MFCWCFHKWSKQNQNLLQRYRCALCAIKNQIEKCDARNVKIEWELLKNCGRNRMLRMDQKICDKMGNKNDKIDDTLTNVRNKFCVFSAHIKILMIKYCQRKDNFNPDFFMEPAAEGTAFYARLVLALFPLLLIFIIILYSEHCIALLATKFLLLLAFHSFPFCWPFCSRNARQSRAELHNNYFVSQNFIKRIITAKSSIFTRSIWIVDVSFSVCVCFAPSNF